MGDHPACQLCVALVYVSGWYGWLYALLYCSPAVQRVHRCAVLLLCVCAVQVCDLLDSNQRMQEELMEKGQAIKVLQQKLADLKKTLQKELVCLAQLVT